MVTDPISDLIISLKNASARGIDNVSVPYSKMKISILEILQKQGFIEDVEKHGKSIKKKINISLKYNDKKPAITDVKRVSKFSRRVYKGFKDIKSIRNGYGTLILSTPKGILTDKEAKKEKVGGEALFEIW